MKWIRSKLPVVRYRLQLCIVILVLTLPFLLGCSLSEKMIDQLAHRFAQLVPVVGGGSTSADYMDVPMTATGSFTLLSQEGWELIQNQILITWMVNPRSGTVSPEVTGEGVRAAKGVGWEMNTTQNLTFTGTVTADGENFKGTVHVIGQTVSIMGTEKLDYPANWDATRRGDIIEGQVDGMGPFQLRVVPLPVK